MLAGGVDDPADLLRGHEGPHPVVHQDDFQLILVLQGLEGVIDAVLAFFAPGHQAQHFLEVVGGDDRFLAQVQIFGMDHHRDLPDLGHGLEDL